MKCACGRAAAVTMPFLTRNGGEMRYVSTCPSCTFSMLDDEFYYIKFFFEHQVLEQEIKRELEAH